MNMKYWPGLRYDIYDYGSYYMVKATDLNSGHIVTVKSEHQEVGKQIARRKVQEMNSEEYYI